MAILPPIEQFVSSTAVRIYRIPVLAFPNLVTYCYMLLGAGEPTLVDTGSGYGDSTAQLISGIEALRGDFGERLALRDLRRIIITHGHIDHFGGLSHFIDQTGVQVEVGIHPLDRRVLTAYEERVLIATKDLRVYLERAGVNETLRAELIDMYGFAKKHVRSVGVDFNLDEYKPIDGMEFIHTPGHCPGQVCIRIGDVLLSADHILAEITPHQAPESITHYTGLGHYLDSLYKMARVDGIRVALGGHEAPVYNVYKRIIAIRASHQRKLDRVLDIIRQGGAPCTVDDITQAMYPDRQGYNVLLALEEVGAHVEYLYERGRLAVYNLDEVERESNPPLQYVAL